MKMKLRPTILILVYLPVVCITVLTLTISYISTNKLVTKELQNSMTGTASTLRMAYVNSSSGQYHQNSNGDVLKGTYNISKDFETIDSIKVGDGLEATFFWGDTRAITTIRNDQNERIVGTKTTDQNVINTVLKNGEVYFDDNLVINGKEYYVLYYPIFQEGSTTEVVGMIFIGTLSENVSSSVMNTVFSILVGIVVLCVVGTILSVYMINSIIRPIKATSKVLEILSTGDMTVYLDEKGLRRVDEIGDMNRSLEILTTKLNNFLKTIAIQSNEISDKSDTMHTMAGETSTTIAQVENAVNDIARGATSQAEDTTQAANYIANMGNLIGETMNEGNVLMNNSNEMTKSGERALGTLQELSQINKRASEAIDIIYEQTNITNESSLKIREATSLITSIAAETNLLSLNASIEAARAGEQGRGFAVVAGQIQKLAEQSNNSANEIDKIINKLIQESNKSVEVMKEVREVMGDQSKKVDNTCEAFLEVKKGIFDSRDNITTISDYFNKLDEARNSITDIIQNLTAIAEENAASSEETSAATTEVAASVENVAKMADALKGIVTKLNESTSKFKVK